MDTRSKTLITLLTVALVVTGGAWAFCNTRTAPSVISSPSDPQPSSHLFVQTAKSGDIIQQNGGYKLVLKGVSPETISFTDRPERLADKMSTQAFIDEWSIGADSFSDDPPNAALVVHDSDGEETIVVELQNPQYENNELQYDILFLNSGGHMSTTIRGSREPDGAIPPHFGEAALFIDNADYMTLDNEHSCQLTGGTWDGEATCTLTYQTTIANNLTVPPGYTLQLNSAAVTIAENGTLISRDGVIKINGGSLVNNGVYMGSNIDINGSATITNTSSFMIYGNVTLYANGAFNNSGYLNVSGSITINTKDGVITNDGSIVNSGYIVISDGTLNNSGTIKNYDSVFEIVNGTVNNTGTICGTLSAGNDKLPNCN